MESKRSVVLPTGYDEAWFRLWCAADGKVVVMCSTLAGANYSPRRAVEKWLSDHLAFQLQVLSVPAKTMAGGSALMEIWSLPYGGDPIVHHAA